PEVLVTSPAAEAAPGPRRSTWDFTLMVATVGLLGALGVQSLAGTLYSWWATRTIAEWQQTGYPGFVDSMNAFAAPLLVALVVVMGLCVPKRLFERRALVGVSALLVLVGLGSWAATGRPTAGLAAYLLGACAIQIAVVVMTIAGAGSLAYLTEGRLTRAGSGLLHLGFILVALDIAALQGTAWFLPGFWVAFAATIGGSALSFYARR
ncbi:MAG TPA: hypothetical protein VF902_03535, partial [Coriobacteriia bacterium]